MDTPKQPMVLLAYESLRPHTHVDRDVSREPKTPALRTLLVNAGWCWAWAQYLHDLGYVSSAWVQEVWGRNDKGSGFGYSGLFYCRCCGCQLLICCAMLACG